MRRPLTYLAAAALAAIVLCEPLAAQGNVPSIGSLSPSSALMGGAGFDLVLNGSNFRQDAVVRWNGSDRTTTYVSNSQLRAAIPASDLTQAGSAQVTVFVPTGGGRLSGPTSFSIDHPVPSVASVSRNPGTAGGEPTTITVTGTGFVPGAEVRWNGSARPTTRLSATRLRASISAADLAAPGAARVTAFNPAPGGGLSGQLSFQIVHQTPRISAIQPARATAGGGNVTITVSGSGFIRSTQSASSTVLWNGAARTTTFDSPTRLRVVIPASDLASPGSASVAVRTRIGTTRLGSTQTSSPTTFTIERPARLGEERLSERGSFNLHTSHYRQLDCNGFGSSFVMVGLRGKHGHGVDEIRVGCRALQADGTLSRTVRWTDRWDDEDEGGTAFPDRVCAQGSAVSAMSVTVENGQLRSITLRCRPLGALGLTGGSEVALSRIGGTGGTAQGPDSCTRGRPARAVRASTDVFKTGVPLGNLFAPWVVAGVQLLCEQPEAP